MPFAEGTPTQLIEMGGNLYELGFTIGAMKRAQKLGVLNVDASDATAMMLALPQYIWACMNEEGRKELSVEAIEELLNPNNIKVIAEAIGELFKESLPKPDVKDEPGAVKPPTPGNSTSTSSGRLVSTT